MEFFKIILFATLLSMGYGIIHDLITANLCIEYFTIGHPIIIESKSPLLLALFWGIFATWWVGLIIGISLALSAQIGSRPKILAKQIIRPMIKLLVVMGTLAIIAGIIGYILAKTEVIYLALHLADKIIAERHALFLTAGWAHGASYLSGFIGGIILCISTFRKRGGMQIATSHNS